MLGMKPQRIATCSVALKKARHMRTGQVAPIDEARDERRSVWCIAQDIDDMWRPLRWAGANIMAADRLGDDHSADGWYRQCDISQRHDTAAVIRVPDRRVVRPK